MGMSIIITIGGFVAVAIFAAVMMYGLPLVIRAFQERRWGSIDGILALTFDDGPDSTTTGLLLDLLDERNAPATFYLVGFRAELNRDMLRRLGGSGHQLATHTHSHKNAWKKPFWFEYRDAMRGYETLSGVVEKHDAYRPPFGKITLLTWLGMRLRGRRVHWWTVPANDTRDSFEDPAVVAGRMLDNGERVVLMHCHHEEPHRREYMLALTRSLIDGARERGLRLVTMRELEGGVRA